MDVAPWIANWILTVSDGITWHLHMVFDVLHGIQLYCWLLFNGIQWYCRLLYNIQWYSLVLQSITWYSMVFDLH